MSNQHQSSLFDDESAASAVPLSEEAVLRFPWWHEEPIRREGAGADLFGDAGPDVVRYGSGASAKWDALGYMLVNAPLGVAATELPPSTVPHLVKYLNRGGKVFVDSGAFGAFRRGEELDFVRDVFPVYDSLVNEAACPQGLLLVMPDKLGDQAGILALQRTHLPKILGWAQSGAELMFPIHSGHQDPRGAYASIAQMLGRRTFVVGIPSAVNAWTVAQILQFCDDVKPARIHLLGMARESAVSKIASAVHAVSPCTRISSDACMLVAHAGRGRRLTDRSNSRLDDAVSWVEAGDIDVPLPDLSTFLTDVIYEPGFLTDKQAVALAKAIGCEGPSWAAGFIEAAASGFQDLLWHLYEDSNEEFAHERLAHAVRDGVYRPWLRRVLAGPIRAYEVARLACNGDPETADLARGQASNEVLLLAA
ncbi:MAG: hypothetical protein C0522_13235 [Rhodocyclaceae bacterium]|nr:hypothetical protein [Rhodocyclaceae bacterium]